MGAAGVPFALVGGQAVALWVASRDPAAVRTTKDVDVLLQREDLPKARAAALAADMDYFEVMGVGMFLDRQDPNPRHAIHLVWAGERVRPEYELPSPEVQERQELSAGLPVVSLAGLVRMKLLSNRDQDRVHLRDMIDVGLVGRELLAACRLGWPSDWTCCWSRRDDDGRFLAICGAQSFSPATQSRGFLSLATGHKSLATSHCDVPTRRPFPTRRRSAPGHRSAGRGAARGERSTRC